MIYIHADSPLDVLELLESRAQIFQVSLGTMPCEWQTFKKSLMHKY